MRKERRKEQEGDKEIGGTRECFSVGADGEAGQEEERVKGKDNRRGNAG